ncbi:MAG TPA: aspartyl/asparaginyl beta-hydroxylase domain-containing protein [Caulobacteraceae bacterium]|nr:aspartyl/asparaginyl beta-hydroxylase domain-containing protein [Caulobacteraceae bacterium]
MERSAPAPSETVAGLRSAADEAARRGDLRGARAALERAVMLDQGSVDLWMSLAGCCRGLGDFAAAGAAVEAALRLDPRSFIALLMKASLLERAGQERASALAYGIALTQAPPDERLDVHTREAVVRARAIYAAHNAQLEEALKAAARRERGSKASKELLRADVFAERLVGKRRVYHQEPVQFHYPGLPEIEFWDRGEFPWIEALEAAAEDIRQELVAILREDGDEIGPYVNYPDGVPLDQWAELNRSPRWGAFHLFHEGREVAWNAKRAPKTMAALAQAPQPTLPNRSPASMFSVLQPRTRIPPHTGIANVRLVTHLALIVPDGCGFRVGSETRHWREGEAWVFDDTIEHEAWNDSDEPRTILICDVWNPRLSADERETVAALMAALDAFNQAAPAGGSL